MVTTDETYNDKYAKHMHDEVAGPATQAGNIALDLGRAGKRYRPTEREKLIAEAKTMPAHDPTTCSICVNWKGNNNPRPSDPTRG